MTLRGKIFWKTSTLSRSEKEDREAERLVQQSPKKKPPRNDLRRNTPREEEKDPDKEQDRKDRSNNYKDAASPVRVALLWVSAAQKNKLITVRRKEDGKVVQVTQDTLRSESGEYEEMEGPEKTPGGAKKDKKPESLRDSIMREYRDLGLSDQEIQDSAEFVRDGMSEEDLDEIRNILNKKVEENKQTTLLRKSLLDRGVSSPSKLKDFTEQVTELYSEKLDGEVIQRVLSKVTPGSSTKDLEKVFSSLDNKVLKAKEQALKDEETAKKKQDPTYDPEDPLPQADSKARSGEKELALARAEKSVSKYREMSQEDRQSHLDQVEEEIEGLPEGSARRLHLEAIKKGIGIASALTDGKEAEGIGGAMAKLISSAEKSGNLRKLLELGDSGPDADPVDSSRKDQEIIRNIFSEVDDDDWEDILPEDHPGRDLAELLGPGAGRYLSEKDRKSIRESLTDLMVGELEILEPEIDELVDPRETRARREEVARAARSTAKPEPKLNASNAKDFVAMFLQSLAEKSSSRIKEFLGIANSKAPEPPPAETKSKPKSKLKTKTPTPRKSPKPARPKKKSVPPLPEPPLPEPPAPETPAPARVARLYLKAFLNRDLEEL